MTVHFLLYILGCMQLALIVVVIYFTIRQDKDKDRLNFIEDGALLVAEDETIQGRWYRTWTCRYDITHETKGFTIRSVIDQAIQERYKRLTAQSENVEDL